MPQQNYDISSFRNTGEDIFVSHLVSIVRPELVNLGNHVAIDSYLHCSTSLETKDYVHISSHVSIIGGKGALLKMGNFTNIAAGGVIICGSDKFLGHGIVSAPNLPDEFRDELEIDPVVFDDFVNLGANVTILPGVYLPQGVVIGACSLVRKKDNLEPWTIYGGNPLRKIKKRDSTKMLEYAKKMGY